MTAPIQEETPFVVTVPNLGPSPFRDDTSVEPEMLAAVDAFVAATAEMAGVGKDVERITAQRGLNDFGKREAFTEQVAKRVLPVLKRHEAALDKSAAHLEAKAAALMAEPEPTPVSVVERQSLLMIADHFGRKSQNERMKLLEVAMSGKDPELAAALATAHTAITGINDATVKLLRRQVAGKRIDPAAAEKLRSQAQKLGAVKAALKAAITSVESAADRKKLAAEGISGLHRGDMTDAEKAQYIGKHGLEAFKKLAQ
jgi:hypothetical protein